MSRAPFAGRETERVYILLVDDRRANLLALEAILRGANYRLITAQSGPAALERVLAHDFAVVLLDVCMPGMDGFECARRIKQQPRCAATPIILLTASTIDPEQVSRGYAVGAVDYLQKPIAPDVVRAKVSVFVQLYHQRKQIERQAAQLMDAGRRERELLMERAEMALNASEAQYEATTRQAPFGAALLARNGAWVRVNRTVCALLGYECAALPHVSTLLDATDADVSARLDDVFCGRQEAFRGEVRLTHHDGSAVWVTMMLARLINDKDSRLALVLEDISARKAAEVRQQFLNQASDILLSALDYHATLPLVLQRALPQLVDWCAIDVVQPDGRRADELMLAVSAESERPAVEGFRRAYFWDKLHDMPRSPWFVAELVEHVTPAWCQSHAAEHAGDACTYAPRTLIIMPLRVHGQTVGAITLARNTGNFVTADLHMVEDLAHRCALAIENTRLYEEAQQAVHARDEFLSVASHELRTPLTPLRIQIQRLIGTAQRAPAELSQDRVREVLRRSDRHVQRLSSLVDTLLDVSHVTSGRLTLNLADTNISEVVHAIAERYAEDAANSGSTLHLHVQDQVMGKWDRMRLEQAVSNLLSNAIKYGEGKPITLTLSSDSDGMVHLVVRDDGIGIAAEKHQVIFERYGRAASARTYGGLGLGLFIAQQIIHAHGGTLRVQSAPNQGATFSMELPLAPLPQHCGFTPQWTTASH